MAGTERIVVQQRDRNFLTVLSMLCVVDHEQAKLVAGFGSTSRANKRLLKLVRAGLLRRFTLGSGGGRKALYALSEKGARLVDVPMRGPRRPQGAMLVADQFVAHQLAVNSIYCGVRFRAIRPPDVSFARWIAFRKTITPELKLIPDGYVELVTPTGMTACFLEVDLGTESLAIWKEKTRQYVQLALSGSFRNAFGQDRFRVLVVAHSERRLETIRKTVAAVTEKIFRFATLDHAETQFFGAVWLKPNSNQPESLFDQQP